MTKFVLSLFALLVATGIAFGSTQVVSATATDVRIIDPVVATNYGPSPTSVAVTYEVDLAHCLGDPAYTARIRIGSGGSVAEQFFVYNNADFPGCNAGSGGTFTKTETVNIPAGTAAGIYDLEVVVMEFAWPGCCGDSDSEAGVVIIGVPLTTDDCKNGGWQTLMDSEGNSFKNQGDCVSFVATKGKNLGAVTP
jgi:hypothetical protein